MRVYTIFLLIALVSFSGFTLQAQEKPIKGYIYVINNPAGLFLRKKPDIDAKRVAAIAYGQQVFTFGNSFGDVVLKNIKGYWMKVYYMDMEGYMFSGFLKQIKEMELDTDVEYNETKREKQTTKNELQPTTIDTSMNTEIAVDTSALYELTLLSKKLLEQLSSLRRDTLVPLSKTDTTIELLDTVMFQTMCKKKYMNYFFDTTSKAQLRLKEYFYFIIDKKGNVVNIEDQRTETNKNTHLFTSKEVDELMQLKFTPAQRNDTLVDTKAPLGIDISADRTKYRAKIKYDKIRIYRRQLFVEYISPEHPHYSIIMEEMKRLGKSYGKYNITLLEGNYGMYNLLKREYNPFSKREKILFSRNFYFITEFLPIKTTKNSSIY